MDTEVTYTIIFTTWKNYGLQPRTASSSIGLWDYCPGHIRHWLAKQTAQLAAACGEPRYAEIGLTPRIGIAQSAVCWTDCPAWYSIMGLILLWTSGRGAVSFGINMGSDSIPPKHTYIPSHRLKRSWHSCHRQVNAGNKNTPNMHYPWRLNVTTSMVGFFV